MEQALTLGPSYLIVPSWFLEQFPGLSGLIQSAGNFAQNVSVAEHDMQMLARVGHRLDSGHPFERIKDSLVKNKTKNIESLAGMFEFARKHGGGDGMPLRSQSQAFIRSSGNSDRRVGPDFGDALQMDIQGPLQTTHVRHGVLSFLTWMPKGLLLLHTLRSLAEKMCFQWHFRRPIAAFVRLGRPL